MKKKVFTLWMALLLLLSLAACGGNGMKDGSSGSQTTESSTAMDVPAMFYETADRGWDGNTPMPEPEVPADAGSAESGYTGIDMATGHPAGAKIIYTADMELETKEFDGASQALADAVKELGGYFESRSVNQGSRFRSMSCTIRMPVENFTTFLDRAGEAAHVTGRSEYQEDVSEIYYDEEARLTTQRTKLERLQELLRKAETMEDIITLESAISETELQIEYLTGSLRKYDSRIRYSTISLRLREVYRLSTDEEVPLTFGERLSSAFSTGLHNGIAGLDDFAIYIARNWVGLLILAAIIAGTTVLFRRRKKKKMERTAPPAAEKDKPEEKKKD